MRKLPMYACCVLLGMAISVLYSGAAVSHGGADPTIEPTVSITQTPAGDSIPEYVTVRLQASVATESTGPITYQWLKDDVGVVGATNRSLILTNGSPYPHWSVPSHSGGYVVVATADGWTATSSVVRITITPDLVPPSFVAAYDEDEFSTKMVRVVFNEALRNLFSDYATTSAWKVVTSTGPGTNWGHPTKAVWRYRGVDLQFESGADPFTRYHLIYTGPPLQDYSQSRNEIATNSIALAAHASELLGFKAMWRYTDDAVDPGPEWQSPEYNDTDPATWKEGPGVFDAKINFETDCRNTAPYGFGNPGTCIRLRDEGKTIITHYFRTRFACPTPLRGAGGILKVSGIMENGGILYLNGTELQRVRMPQGPVTRYTEATTEMGDTAPHDFFYFLRPDRLITGTNLLAAELHLVNFSSDLTFGLRVQLIDSEPLSPRLDVHRSVESGDIILNWETGWTLQESSTITGTAWTDIGTSGTHIIAPTTSQKFYRLRW